MSSRATATAASATSSITFGIRPTEADSGRAYQPHSLTCEAAPCSRSAVLSGGSLLDSSCLQGPLQGPPMSACASNAFAPASCDAHPEEIASCTPIQPQDAFKWRMQCGATPASSAASNQGACKQVRSPRCSSGGSRPPHSKGDTNNKLKPGLAPCASVTSPPSALSRCKGTHQRELSVSEASTPAPTRQAPTRNVLSPFTRSPSPALSDFSPFTPFPQSRSRPGSVPASTRLTATSCNGFVIHQVPSAIHEDKSPPQPQRPLSSIESASWSPPPPLDIEHPVSPPSISFAPAPSRPGDLSPFSVAFSAAWSLRSPAVRLSPPSRLWHSGSVPGLDTDTDSVWTMPIGTPSVESPCVKLQLPAARKRGLRCLYGAETAVEPSAEHLRPKSVLTAQALHMHDAAAAEAEEPQNQQRSAAHTRRTLTTLSLPTDLAVSPRCAPPRSPSLPASPSSHTIPAKQPQLAAYTATEGHSPLAGDVSPSTDEEHSSATTVVQPQLYAALKADEKELLEAYVGSGRSAVASEPVLVSGSCYIATPDAHRDNEAAANDDERCLYHVPSAVVSRFHAASLPHLNMTPALRRVIANQADCGPLIVHGIWPGLWSAAGVQEDPANLACYEADLSDCDAESDVSSCHDYACAFAEAAAAYETAKNKHAREECQRLEAGTYKKKVEFQKHHSAPWSRRHPQHQRQTCLGGHRGPPAISICSEQDVSQDGSAAASLMTPTPSIQASLGASSGQLCSTEPQSHQQQHPTCAPLDGVEGSTAGAEWASGESLRVHDIEVTICDTIDAAGNRLDGPSKTARGPAREVHGQGASEAGVAKAYDTRDSSVMSDQHCAGPIDSLMCSSEPSHTLMLDSDTTLGCVPKMLPQGSDTRPLPARTGHSKLRCSLPTDAMAPVLEQLERAGSVSVPQGKGLPSDMLSSLVSEPACSRKRSGSRWPAFSAHKKKSEKSDILSSLTSEPTHNRRRSVSQWTGLTSLTSFLRTHKQRA